MPGTSQPPQPPTPPPPPPKKKKKKKRKIRIHRHLCYNQPRTIAENVYLLMHHVPNRAIIFFSNAHLNNNLHFTDTNIPRPLTKDLSVFLLQTIDTECVKWASSAGTYVYVKAFIVNVNTRLKPFFLEQHIESRFICTIKLLFRSVNIHFIKKKVHINNITQPNPKQATGI